eukprot:gene20167-22142_t
MDDKENPRSKPVDRSNYKTCQQSSFCRRNRAIEEGKSPFSILPDSVIFNSGLIKANICNCKTNVILVLTVEVLQNNTTRFRINELDPIRPRYECKESLVDDPVHASYVKEKDDASGCKINFEKNSISINYKPFQLEFFQDGNLHLAFNTRGLMNFEHYRLKGKKDDKDGETGNEEEGLWEESFNGFEDTKPRGPSSVAMDVSFIGFEHVYGIPEHADSLALKDTTNGEPYRLYNLDSPRYELYNPMALYGSIPYMIAHNKTTTLGIFWNNASETWVDIKSSERKKSGESPPETGTHWISESGIIDVFVLLGPRPHDVFQQYATLTGTTELPPLFAIAYHQSRWNYNDENDVNTVDKNFNKHDIPYDVLWLDIEHTKDKKFLTWDASKFPKPKKMQEHLAGHGRKMVAIADPHVKRETECTLYSEASVKGFLVRDKAGQQYIGRCWPGSSSWIDFTHPPCRDWWADRLSYRKYEGSTPNLFTWNDMNEPSVFDGPEKTMHKDALHRGDWEHRDLHNIYGMCFQQATAHGQIQRSGGKERPFVLSRAFFAGTQRFGAVWTGDNAASWEYLKISVPMLLSIGITADVGGFFQNPDSELLVRWYQAGAFQPFFRAHACLNTSRREPWLFDKDTKLMIREAIRKRYILLPFWYNLFQEASTNGSPIMRPLWVEFPEETETFGMDDEYLLGSDILVKPVTKAGQKNIDVYFPGGDNEIWYDMHDYGTSFRGGSKPMTIDTPLQKIPAFHRGGSIIPHKETVRKASSLTHNDPYTLIAALNSNNEALGTLYIDDGHSFDYKERKYLKIKYEITEMNFIARREHSSFETKACIESIVILGVSKPLKTATLTTASKKKELRVSYSAEKKVFVMSKFGMNVAEEFSIAFT